MMQISAIWNISFQNVCSDGDLYLIHHMLGVCPQHDVLYDDLSVKQHMEMFAHIRGVEDVNTEVGYHWSSHRYLLYISSFFTDMKLHDCITLAPGPMQTGLGMASAGELGLSLRKSSNRCGKPMTGAKVFLQEGTKSVGLEYFSILCQKQLTLLESGRKPLKYKDLQGHGYCGWLRGFQPPGEPTGLAHEEHELPFPGPGVDSPSICKDIKYMVAAAG
jgi:hypothetical protein